MPFGEAGSAWPTWTQCGVLAALPLSKGCTALAVRSPRSRGSDLLWWLLGALKEIVPSSFGDRQERRANEVTTTLP